MNLLDVLNPKISWRDMVLVGLVGLPVVVSGFWLWDPLGCREITSKLRHGMTEPEIVRALGKAPSLTYDRARAPADYYVEGWGRRERPITHRVLIFELGHLICYVWLDEQDLVEDAYLGGS